MYRIMCIIKNILLWKKVKIDDRRKRYVNPITLSYVLRPTYLAALCKIKKKDEEWQQKFQTFEEVQWVPVNKKPPCIRNRSQFSYKTMNKTIGYC